MPSAFAAAAAVNTPDMVALERSVFLTDEGRKLTRASEEMIWVPKRSVAAGIFFALIHR
jgi:hypothetical protein